MPEDRNDLIAHYRRMHADLLGAIDGIPDDLLVEPSLDGWSVKDHLTHLALWDDIRTNEVNRISAGYESAWRMTGAQDEALNTIAHDLRLNLSLAQARWELEESRDRLLDAIANASERGLDPSLYGEAGLHSTHEAQHTEWIKRWRQEKGL